VDNAGNAIASPQLQASFEIAAAPGQNEDRQDQKFRKENADDRKTLFGKLIY